MERGENVFKLKTLDLTFKDNVADEYTAENTDKYKNLNIQVDPDEREEMEKHLENNYKKEIKLSEITAEDILSMKQIYRQVKRLKYCFLNIKYKMGIIYRNYICAIDRYDEINCFSIKHYPDHQGKKLFIITDLETLFEKNDKIIEDIASVRNSIYDILQINQNRNIELIDKMIENKKEAVLLPKKMEMKNKVYDMHILELSNMISSVNSAETRVLKKIEDLYRNKNPNLQADISIAHNRSVYDKELAEIASAKNDISMNIIDMRTKKENAIIEIDKIMFDNTVMFDTIIKNFEKLKGFY